METQENLSAETPRNLVITPQDHSKDQVSFKTMLDRFYQMNTIQKTEGEGRSEQSRKRAS